VPMIGDDRRREEPGELQPAVAVRRAHHGNLNALIAQPSNTSGPFSFDRGPPFEIEAELAKEFDRRCEVIDDDSYVVHSSKRHICAVYKVAFIPATNRAANCCGAFMRTPKTNCDIKSVGLAYNRLHNAIRTAPMCRVRKAGPRPPLRLMT